MVIEPQPEAEAPDERSEIEIERVADEAHAQHALRREFMFRVGAAEQIVRRVGQMAERDQSRGGGDRERRIARQRAPYSAPVDRLHVIGNQPGDEQEESEADRGPEKRPPARRSHIARRGGQRGPQAVSSCRCVEASGIAGLRCAECAGSKPAHFGKLRVTWYASVSSSSRNPKWRCEAALASSRRQSSPLSRSSRQRTSALNWRSRIITFASRFSERLNGSRLLEPTVDQRSSTSATLACSGRLQYS